ncbi:hypothetical protein [Streptomyces sp. NPDC018647]|uniref:hypothetical protein n=2 Tax=Streptomyces TaxID=1883 RepID=UPI0037A1E60A
MKRNVHAWVELYGTQSGSWLSATRIDAGRGFADPLPTPVGESLYMLGAAHRACLDAAVDLLRQGRAVFDHPLQEAFVDVPPHGQALTNWLPAQRGRCPFCQDLEPNPTKEDIYPKWLIRELRRLGVRSGSPDPRQRKVEWPTTPVCQQCNNNWMSVLENDVSSILLPMFFNTRLVSEQEQVRLALWAAMKAVLFDSAGEAVIPRGFGQSLELFRHPHPGMHVWIAAYHDSNPLTLVVRPIYAAQEVEGGSDQLDGWCATFSVLRVAFQVFIPFAEGDLAPLPDFHGSVVKLWPPSGEVLDWPPPYYFDSKSINGLAARINDNQEVVQMEVTLTEAVREPGPPGTAPNP